MDTDRRGFLGVAGLGLIGSAFFGLRELIRRTEPSRSPSVISSTPSRIGYGFLVRDPEGILDLPAGFSYRVISRRGDEMDDGLLVPGAPDGMATFAGPDGLTILIRNHELNPDGVGPWGKSRERLSRVERRMLYDFGHGTAPGCGGTTTVVFDTQQQKVVRQFLSLAGTTRNCAGGPTPWGSWISCEETVQRIGPGDKGARYTAERDHGYVFEVPATDQIQLARPIPIKSMGRFNHEAIAVHRPTGIVYETEDRADGLLYRFIPKSPGNLAAGGRLQALKLIDQPSADTRNGNSKSRNFPVGERLEVVWLDMHDVESPKDDLRQRGFVAGAARFARGEGMWAGENEIYFACTNGGRKQKGQIWRYIPSPHEGATDEQRAPGRIGLFIEPNDGTLIENADNLTISPWGDLIVCEDRTTAEVRLIGVTPDGECYTFANNRLHTEFAGATFSPDGSTLFVNIQGKGLTLAITGPWREHVAASLS
jgi:secreted PhoX family phosphatase